MNAINELKVIKERGYSQVYGSLAIQKLHVSQKKWLQAQSPIIAYEKERWLDIRSEEVKELTKKLEQVKQLITENQIEELKQMLKRGEI